MFSNHTATARNCYLSAAMRQLHFSRAQTKNAIIMLVCVCVHACVCVRSMPIQCIRDRPLEFLLLVGVSDRCFELFAISRHCLLPFGSELVHVKYCGLHHTWFLFICKLEYNSSRHSIFLCAQLPIITRNIHALQVQNIPCIVFKRQISDTELITSIEDWMQNDQWQVNSQQKIVVQQFWVAFQIDQVLVMVYVVWNVISGFVPNTKASRSALVSVM